MQSLSPEARARLAEFQRDQSPDPADEARVLAAIERRIAAPVRPRWTMTVVTVMALAAALVLVMRWVVAPVRPGEERGVQAPYEDEPRSVETVREVLMRPVIPAAPVVVPEVEVVVEAPVPSVTSPRRPRVREADDIAAEVALLRAAKLAAGARRLELLAEHARRFPGGAFAAERGLLEVETRCELGEVDEARALAARFMTKFPGSPLAARVAKICSDED